MRNDPFLFVTDGFDQVANFDDVERAFRTDNREA
jgi:hypothetical protein